MSKSDQTAHTSPMPSDAISLVTAGFSLYDDDSKDGERETYDFPYFLVRTRSLCRGVSDADLQDIAQEAWISFSNKSMQGGINNPKAYIVQIIRRKFIDYLRQEQRRSRLPTISLSLYAENSDVEYAALSSRGLSNPANELDAHMEKIDFLNSLAAILPRLAPRQRRVMICTLLDKSDDPLLIKLALKRHHIDESEMYWPVSKQDKRLLQASFPAACRTLANLMHIDLCQYNQKKRSLQPVSH